MLFLFNRQKHVFFDMDKHVSLLPFLSIAAEHINAS